MSPLGYTLGRYKTRSKIGEGGTVEVYIAVVTVRG
jgi:hypothetical protein